MIKPRHPRHFKQASFQSKARVLCCVSLLIISSLPLSREASAESLIPQQALQAPHSKPLSPIEELARRLGDESFEQREQAMAELWKLGRVTLPVLRRVETGDDIEASERARELIGYISVGLLFDCPEEAKELVLRFFQSSYDGKIIILHQLMKLDQWKQVLHLGKLDNDPKVKRVMAAISWPRVQSEIKTSLAANDHQKLEGIMSLMGDSDLHMRARAFYYAHTDQLDRELAKAAGLTGETASRWRIWLYRCSGNLKAAIEESEKAKKSKIADLLKVLDGNALPWLERSVPKDDAIYQWGCELQRLRLQGKDVEAERESKKWSDIVVVDPQRRSSVVRCLAVNGFRDQALNLLQSSDADAAFYFYDAAELPRQSLKSLGIQADAKPPYIKWVGEHIKQIKEGNQEAREAAADQLMMLASFLYARGEQQHASEVLTPMMALLIEENEDWNEYVEMMFNGGLGSLGVYFIKQKLDQQDADQDELVETVRKMFDHLEPALRNCLWAHLTGRHGDDLESIVDEVGLLVGLLPDPEDQAVKIHNELLLNIGEKDAPVNEGKNLLINTLYHLCIARNDLNEASRMIDDYANESSALQLAQHEMNYNLSRWQRIEPALAARAKSQAGDRRNLIKWHIALRKLGENQKAQKALDRAMRLCVGDPDSLIDCGHYLHAAGYDQKAIELWVHAAMISDFSDHGLDDFVWAVTLLASNGQSFYARGDWQKAWSINEVFARFIMRSSSVDTHVALKARYQAEFCHGMMMLEQGREEEGMKRLEIARQMIPGDGALADDFFPALRNKIPTKIYHRWFDESYAHILQVCDDYPQSHNAHNTAAWLASRAVRHLDEAHAHAQKAVALRPNQGAYLDTMAEVWFAKGNREKALRWSEKAIAGSISNASGSPRSLRMVYANYQQLKKQYQHFKNDPLPSRAR